MGLTRHELTRYALTGTLPAERAPRQATAEDMQAFLQDYTAHVADGTHPYPGVPAMLDAARAAGWTLAVVTNPPEAPARAII